MTRLRGRGRRHLLVTLGGRSKGVSTMALTHLQRLEAETIQIMREVVAETEKPVMLYSIGKDSAVMLHIARKAFYPAAPPFPLLHVDTTWKFKEMYAMRDRMARESGMDLIVHVNPEALAKGINPFTQAPPFTPTSGKRRASSRRSTSTASMPRSGAPGGTRRNRVPRSACSPSAARSTAGSKNQRPELWRLYNTRKHKGESIRVFLSRTGRSSTSGNTSTWRRFRSLPSITARYGRWSSARDAHHGGRRPDAVAPGRRADDAEGPVWHPRLLSADRRHRIAADTLAEIIAEMMTARTSEREGRVIDRDAPSSMEIKKQEGYF